MEVFRRKSVEQCLQDADDPERHLRRALGPVQLTAIGIGVIIGTGIFVLTGEAAGTVAGPAITLSFVIVAIKLAIILLVIIAGLSYIHTGNYHPFIPPTGAKPAAGGSSGSTLLQDIGAAPGAFGVAGIFSGAALVFFAFIGFDIVATNAEEAKKPQRALPLGIFLSLTICALLYVAVSLVVTGMVKYNHIDVN